MNKQLTLRLRKPGQRLPDEYVLNDQYTLNEVQDDINVAIDFGEDVRLILRDGAIFEFDPGEFEVISVAYPTELTERRALEPPETA